MSLKLSVIESPEPIAILPSFASTIPELDTYLPNKLALPPLPTLIRPPFLTPLDSGVALKLNLSLRKSLLFISNEDAVKEPVLTTPEGEITTPFGFIKKTFPLEFSFPEIVDGVDPVTLFKEADEDEGILKSTLPFL